MNEYMLEIYEERRETAEACRERLMALQAEILRKSEAFVDRSVPYTSADRAADRGALQEAMEQLTLAIKAILDIEEAVKG